VGAGARGQLIRIEQELGGNLPYGARAVLFGGAVLGPKVPFTRGITNQEYFQRRNAQMAWALRMRAQRLNRLVQEDELVVPAQCIFVDPSIPKLHQWMVEMAQPLQVETPSGKLGIDKAPADAPSPDLFDATCLAFAHDCSKGLLA